MLDSLVLSWRLVQRHWLVYRKDLFANILPTFSDPLFFLVAFGLGLGAYVDQVEGMSYSRYMAPGLAMSAALFTGFFETSYNLYVRLVFEGIYHAVLATPLGPKEIVTGELLWVAIKGAIMSFGVTLIVLAFGLVDARYIFLIPIIGAMVALSCGTIGVFATSKVRNINQFQTVYSLVIAPLFYFSGIFYPISSTPQWVQWIAQLSPLYHGVRMAQQALWGENVLEALLVHGSILLVMIFFGLFVSYKNIIPKLQN
ncbi:MAG: ABC transporter permease [Bdellovibrionales bacterium]|nr:ABC transporter permease [Bdellovibrionales bacterium]